MRPSTMGDMTARGFVLAAAVVALGAALTSCGTVAGTGTPSGSASGSTSPTVTAPPSTSTAPQDPTALVGSWLVTQAAGAEPGTVLRLGEDLSLWQSCGYLMGSWRASTTSLFSASLVGGDGGCFGAGVRRPTPAWLAAATRFDVSGDGAVLLDSSGRTVARLSPGGRPTPGSNLLPSLADPPVLTPQLRKVLAAPLPLPPTAMPATRQQLLGRWVTTQERPSSGLSHDVVPGITFSDDGSYAATDGCNGTEGRWAADDSGSLLVSGGFSTAIGCDNVDVALFAGRAAWATLDDGVLVLIGPDGAETGRLRRP